ncbi:hypothetical protein F8388_017777 [Cannabis sativa]|uniref:Uncharacterized protein n=1 Tax=Cannabis sativa TaxID=3483 RepID=A0A7J6E5F5_CANSA|nr:hypothetical protein F8388_017777 [Cannabis sativa]
MAEMPAGECGRRRVKETGKKGVAKGRKLITHKRAKKKHEEMPKVLRKMRSGGVTEKKKL